MVVAIVVVEPAGEGAGSFGGGAVDGAVGPAAEHGADEALGFAVCAGPVGPGARWRRPSVRQARAWTIEGSRSRCRSSRARRARRGARKTRRRGAGSRRRCGLLVGEHLDVGEPGGVVDADMDVLPAEPARPACRAALGCDGPADAVAGTPIRPSFLTSMCRARQDSAARSGWRGSGGSSRSAYPARSASAPPRPSIAASTGD